MPRELGWSLCRRMTWPRGEVCSSLYLECPRWNHSRAEVECILENLSSLFRICGPICLLWDQKQNCEGRFSPWCQKSKAQYLDIASERWQLIPNQDSMLWTRRICQVRTDCWYCSPFDRDTGWCSYRHQCRQSRKGFGCWYRPVQDPLLFIRLDT